MSSRQGQDSLFYLDVFFLLRTEKGGFISTSLSAEVGLVFTYV